MILRVCSPQLSHLQSSAIREKYTCKNIRILPITEESMPASNIRVKCFLNSDLESVNSDGRVYKKVSTRFIIFSRVVLPLYLNT